MRITLMPYVENQFIFRKIENVVKGYRRLDYAEIGGKMPAVFFGGVYYKRTYLFAKSF